MSDKKKMQLGMNPSTASNRLVKDLLWKLVQQTGQSTCCKCNEPMSRDTFSIEHVTPWLDSPDPVGLYFDVENINFSHLRCNVGDRRQTVIAICGTDSKYSQGCRCNLCKDVHASNKKSRYNPQLRREKYLKKGY